MLPLTYKTTLGKLVYSKVNLLKTCVRYYEIPSHLQCVIDEKDPSFDRMVEYFYHNAVKVVEPALVEYLMKHSHLSDKKRNYRVAGILKVSFCAEVKI